MDTQMYSGTVKYRFAIDINILYAEAAVYAYSLTCETNRKNLVIVLS